MVPRPGSHLSPRRTAVCGYATIAHTKHLCKRSSLNAEQDDPRYLRVESLDDFAGHLSSTLLTRTDGSQAHYLASYHQQLPDRQALPREIVFVAICLLLLTLTWH